MHIHKRIQAFTLTELVIIITILAILSTIAFVSYSNNISKTRDDRRQLDIDNIQIALSTFKSQNWYYPLPWDTFNITYSWSIVAKQWVLNTQVILSSLESIPTDPLDNNYYSYSVTTDQKQYQLAATLENDWEETILLSWDYQSVAKTILPNILLASDAWPWDNIEIGEWVWDWRLNRKLFLFNQSSNNIIHSREWWWAAVTGWEELNKLITQAEANDYWQRHDYQTCDQISDAWKNIGPWDYQIMWDDWTLSTINCWGISWTVTCTSTQHLEWWVCVDNIRACAIPNGTWSQTWNNSTSDWEPNPCTPDSCNSGYQNVSWTCIVICTAWWETPCVVQ